MKSLFNSCDKNFLCFLGVENIVKCKIYLLISYFVIGNERVNPIMTGNILLYGWILKNMPQTTYWCMVEYLRTCYRDHMHLILRKHFLTVEFTYLWKGHERVMKRFTAFCFLLLDNVQVHFNTGSPAPLMRSITNNNMQTPRVQRGMQGTYSVIIFVCGKNTFLI